MRLTQAEVTRILKAGGYFQRDADKWHVRHADHTLAGWMGSTTWRAVCVLHYGRLQTDKGRVYARYA